MLSIFINGHRNGQYDHVIVPVVMCYYTKTRPTVYPKKYAHGILVPYGQSVIVFAFKS